MASQDLPLDNSRRDTKDERVASDPTFRAYTKAQAAAYARSRSGYSDTLYEYVMNHHRETGGAFDRVLDVGCGPGNSTRDLATYFDHATGCDPGHAMIEQARIPGYKTRVSEKIVFEVCSAEEVEVLDSVTLGSVDMITCAMSAHWFKMDQFYPAAARLLKTGGTLAMWTCGSFFVHPETPSAARVQKVLSDLETITLAPYTAHGNMLSYHIYDDLELPWSFQPALCLTEFSEHSIHRKAWNRGGIVSEEEGGGYMSGASSRSLAEIRLSLGTASMVTRWRDANKEKVQTGEIRDCIDETLDNIKIAMAVKHIDEKDITLRTGMATGLIILKRT